MKKLQELEELKKEALEEIKLREGGEKIRVIVGLGTCGIAAGAREVMNTFLEEINSKKLDIQVTQTGCIGFCVQEPIVEIHVPGKQKVTYGKITADMAREIVRKHLIDNIVQTQWIIHE